MQILQVPDSSWGLTVLKNIFLRFIGLKGLKMVWKKVPWFEIFFPDFGWKTPVFPWFPWLEKSSKFSLNSLISLIGGNPARYFILMELICDVTTEKKPPKIHVSGGYGTVSINKCHFKIIETFANTLIILLL